MQFKSYFIPLATFALISCSKGSDTHHTEQQAGIDAKETKVVDSISTAIEVLKADISQETEATVLEIDSLLKDI